MAKCDRHIWDTEDREPCWKCEELRYSKTENKLTITNMPKEHCVMCGKETNVDVNTHVDLRSNYIEGVGQLCRQCYSKDSVTEDYQAPKVAHERIETIQIPVSIIKETPNDFELGGKIRNLLS
jgi:hypothetical protein